MNRSLTLLLALLIAAPALYAGQSVINSVHNLSASGPGSIRATSEEQVCIFCHTPHHAGPVQPLWNRNVVPAGYTPYRSNSLQAVPGQPTGSSKLCLSCHDGTIALGSILSRNQPIGMAGGMTTLPPGHASRLGTDLSDDHPISFRYDAALLAKNPKLKDPQLLPPAVRLDQNKELQCTTCHEPHDNTRGKFLVMSNSNSELCKSCHQPGSTTVVAHQNCASCHQPHTAPSGPYLLRAAKVADTCTHCHSSVVTNPHGPNVADDIAKASKHETRPGMNVATHVPNDATCSDCHGPHSMKTQVVATAPQIPGNFGDVRGVSISGTPVYPAQYAYEVCLLCHSSPAASNVQRISRQVEQTNLRLKFDSTAISYHPVVSPGRSTSTDVPSLIPTLTVASQIYCHDCHSSDSTVKGTHGSTQRPLLAARYDTIAVNNNWATGYALCYKCHQENILYDTNNSVGRLHDTHVKVRGAPCAACHDAHGIPSGTASGSDHTHLINFNTTMVSPVTSPTRLQFRDLGSRTGQCFLECHSTVHNPRSY